MEGGTEKFNVALHNNLSYEKKRKVKTLWQSF